MNLESRLDQLENRILKELSELRKLIAGKNIAGNWVMQPMACAMLNVSARQMRNIRLHTDKHGKAVGCIRWRKGKGKTVQYFKPDLEKYLDQITIA